MRAHEFMLLNERCFSNALTHTLTQVILLTVSALNSCVSDDEAAATVDGDDCFIFILDNGC